MCAARRRLCWTHTWRQVPTTTSRRDPGGRGHRQRRRRRSSWQPNLTTGTGCRHNGLPNRTHQPGAAGSPCTCCRFAYAFPRARTHVARHSTHIPRIHTHTLSLSAVVGQARPRACRFAAAPQPLRGRKTGPQRRPTSGRGAIRRCGVGQARKRACFATWDHTKHAPFITPGRGFDHRGRPWSIPTCSLLAFTQALPACLTMPSLGPERCLSVRTRGPPPLLKFACHRPLSPAASACLCLRALITGPTSWGTQTRQPSRAMARLLMRLPPSGPRDSEYPSHSTVTVRGHE